ncbi:MAG: DUF3368 domain-containing protein [Roseburia sp.]|nr:DUF3368 domain-containing protein [Roseburia sp.]MCM1278082.1 DUF3368 domain-containing protein [Robinsoniella sp.]
MIVISDTTPILSLLKAKQLELLRQLYGSVIVPEAVYEELTMNSAFVNERAIIMECSFIVVEKVHNQESVRLLRDVTGLDAGESEALILYKEKKADILLMDEHKGRSVAKKMSVEHIGTVGILMSAYDSNAISAHEVEYCLEVFLDKDIRLSRRLCNKVLNYVGLNEKF